MDSENEVYEKFGAKIKEMRQSRNVSQVELARELHISQTAMFQYENGSRKIPLTLLIRLAEYFDTPVDDLIGTRIHSYGGAPGAIVTTSKVTAEHQARWFDTFGGVKWTDEEIAQIINFAKYLLSQREEREDDGQ